MAVASPDQLLRHDRLQGERELRAYLGLLASREDVDDAGEGLYRRAGVEGGKHQMTRLCHRQRCLDGLAIAHLPDEHYVRVLPQHVLEGRRKSAGVASDLTLGDQTALGLVHELDGSSSDTM